MNKWILSMIMSCFLLVINTVQAADYQYQRDILYRPDSTNRYIQEMCRLDVAYQADAKAVSYTHLRAHET